MDELPPGLRAAVADADLSTVLEWWGRLPQATRLGLAVAYDGRWEECFFGPTPAGEAVPAVEGGRFVPADAARWPGEWEDWQEYLFEHKEEVILISMFHQHWGWGRSWFEVEDLPPSQQPRWEDWIFPPRAGSTHEECP